MPSASAALRAVVVAAVAVRATSALPLTISEGLLAGVGQQLGLAPGNGTDQWLQKWLASLNISVPPVSTSALGFNISITGMYCDGIQAGGIETTSSSLGEVTIRGKGLKASCHLDCLVVSPRGGKHDIGHVSADVDDATLGSPIRIITSSGDLALPDKIDAYDCPNNSEFDHITVATDHPVLSGLINNVLIPLLRSTIKGAACKGLDDAVNLKGTGAMQNFSREVRTFMAGKPASIVPSLPEPHSDFVDLAANPAMELVKQITVHVLGNSSSQLSLNAIMSRLLGPHGHLSLGSLYKLPVFFSIKLPKLGSVNITLKAVEMNGLNSWSSVLLEAPAAHNLSYNLSVDRMAANVSFDLSAAPDPHGGIINGSTLDESFNMTVSLGALRLAGGAFIALNQSRLGMLSIDQLVSPGCSAPAVYSAMLQEAGLAVEPLNLSVQPGASVGSLELDLDHMINAVFAMLLGLFSETIAAVVEHATEVNLTDAANGWLRNQTALAALDTCPAPANDYTSPAFGEFAGTAALLLLTIGALGLLAGTAKHLRRCTARLHGGESSPRSSSEAISPARGSPGEQSTRRQLHVAEMAEAPGQEAIPTEHFAIHSFADAQSSPTFSAEPGSPGPPTFREAQGSLGPQRLAWDCLALHPSVSRFMMAGLPLLIVADILLFAEGNFGGPGTSVYVSIQANGEEVVRLPSVKDFSLFSSITDMWNGRVYALALLIAFFSGIWPYIKLLAMLACWLMPTRKLSIKNRLRVLEWLDALGKWSLVDAFVMVLFMVAFEFDLSVAGQAPPVVRDVFDEFGGSARLLVYVKPEWGFHLFVFATLGSLILGHLMTMVHRRAYKIAEFGIRRDDEPACGCTGRSRLCDVSRPAGLHAGRAFVYGPLVSLAFSLLLVLVGLDVNTFQFRFLGLAALALGPEGSVRPFSVASLASEVPSTGLHPHAFDLVWLQFVFCVFSMWMVIAYHITLMVLWAAPLTNRLQRHGLVCAQVMNAWSALDVFMVSIMAGVLEIRQFALFIIGDKCDGLDALVAKIPPIASRVPGAITCFDVESELQPGFYVLLVAVIVSTIVGNIVMHRCSEALEALGVAKRSGTSVIALAVAGDLDEDAGALPRTALPVVSLA